MPINSRDDLASAPAAGPDPRGDAPARRRLAMGGAALGGLAAVLGAVTLLAWFLAGTSGSPPGFEEADGRTLVPAAADDPARIAALAVEGQGNATTLRRADGGWVLAEGDGYPVDSRRVESVLAALGALRAAYVSEDGSPSAGEYGFGALDDPTGTAARITLRGADDTVLGHLTLGNVVTVPGGANLSKLALKRDDDSRIWLAEGDLQVSASPLEWVDRGIFHASRNRVVEVAITPPDGERLVVRRATGSGELRVAEGLPSGAAIEGPWVLEELASVLEHLEFAAVRSAGNLGREGDSWQARVATADGVVIAATLFPGKDRSWAIFEARPAGPGEAVRDAARDFNARHRAWAYALTDYAAGRFMTRPEDLINSGDRSSARARSP